MRRSYPITLIFSLVILTGSAPALPDVLASARSAKKRPAGKTAPVSSTLSPDKWVTQTLQSMTLREKVGQMMMVPFSGVSAQPRGRAWRELRQQIAQNRVGGMIMYRGDPHQAAALTNKLQRLSKVPLLFASDFERGASSQMKAGAPFTTNMAVGATGSEDYAYFQGQVTALEARAVGIHWVFAPVADVNNNPDNPIINVRSYGEDPPQVARMVGAFVRGVQENGALATLKHFPGHGDTNVDSHIGLATIPADRQRLETIELLPFKAGIARGAGAIMAAHLAVPKVTHEAGLPATLSPDILTTLLRRDLGYQGLVVTDAMNMGGITKNFKGDEAAVRAIAAGVDVILTPPNPTQAIQGVLEAVRSGRLTPRRIDESVRRILQAKAQLGLPKNRFVKPAAVDKVFGAKAYAGKAQEIADRSITLLRNEDRIVPVPRAASASLFSLVLSDEAKSDIGDVFQDMMRKHGPAVTTATLNSRSSEEDMRAVLAQARKASRIICAPFVSVRAQKGTVGLPEKQSALITQLLQLDKPTLIVAFGSPYLIRQFPQTRNYMVTYSLTETAQRAAAKAVLGEISAQGRLPISIPGLFAVGDGITKTAE